MATVVRYAICKLMRQYVINNFRISYSDCFHDGSGVVAFNDKPDVLSLILGNKLHTVNEAQMADVWLSLAIHNSNMTLKEVIG